MNRVLVTILIVSLLSPLVLAQQPNPQIPDWNLGWEVEQDKAIMELDSNMNFELVLTFWVSNTGLLPQELSMEVELDESLTTDFPSQITADGNSNKTYDLIISGSGFGADGELRSSMSIFDTVVLTANQKIAEQNVGQKEIEMDLQFSAVFGFDIEMSPASGSGSLKINSGTSENVVGTLSITGNSDDAITKVDLVVKKCPQINHELLSGLETSKAITNSQSFEIKLLAPSNHPDKECVLSVSVTSEGNGMSYNGEFEFTVDAPERVVEDNSDDDPVQEVDESQYEVESSSLPATSLASCVILLLFVAIIRRE